MTMMVLTMVMVMVMAIVEGIVAITTAITTIVLIITVILNSATENKTIVRKPKVIRMMMNIIVITIIKNYYKRNYINSKKNSLWQSS